MITYKPEGFGKFVCEWPAHSGYLDKTACLAPAFWGHFDGAAIGFSLADDSPRYFCYKHYAEYVGAEYKQAGYSHWECEFPNSEQYQDYEDGGHNTCCLKSANWELNNEGHGLPSYLCNTHYEELIVNSYNLKEVAKETIGKAIPSHLWPSKTKKPVAKKAPPKPHLPATKGKAEVWLIAEERANGAIMMRLMAEKLPYGAEQIEIALSQGDPNGCLTPITRLWEHDHHMTGIPNAAAKKAYINRVVKDVQTKLGELDWSRAEPTGYNVIKLNFTKTKKEG